MHAMHVVLKIVHVTSMCECNFYCELAVVLSKVSLKKRAELHTDIKNKVIGTRIADTEMIHISAVYG